MRYAVMMDTPVGSMLLVEENDALVGAHLPVAYPPLDLVLRETAFLREASRQFEAYFDGSATAFDLPLRFHGTPFQIAIWNAIRDIPYAGTRAYGDIARAIGQPNAARAVGGACRVSQFSIVVPCHRVISAGGGIGGYGGEVDVKRALLLMEGVVL